jgi:hypothetical protein
LAGEGLKDIRQGQKATPEGNLFSGQAMGIPLTVPTFVVVENNIFFLRPKIQRLQNFVPQGGVGFEASPLPFGEGAGNSEPTIGFHPVLPGF